MKYCQNGKNIEFDFDNNLMTAFDAQSVIGNFKIKNKIRVHLENGDYIIAFDLHRFGRCYVWPRVIEKGETKHCKLVVKELHIIEHFKSDMCNCFDFETINSLKINSWTLSHDNWCEIFNVCQNAKKLHSLHITDISINSDTDIVSSGIIALLKGNKRLRHLHLTLHKKSIEFQKIENYLKSEDAYHIISFNVESSNTKKIILRNKRMYEYLKKITVILLHNYKQFVISKDVVRYIAKLVSETTKRDVAFYDQQLKRTINWGNFL